MAQRAEEWLELCDCPVVGLGGRGYRLAAVHMVGVGAREVLSTGAKHARVVHQNRNRYAKGPREEGLPEVEGPVGTITANVTQQAQRCIMDFTRLGVLGFGLEKFAAAESGGPSRTKSAS